MIYMDKKISIYFALASLLALSSCSQENAVDSERPAGNNRIYFRSYLPAVTQTRAEVITGSNFTTAQVTCFNPTDTDNIDPDSGEITPYFTDERFEKADDGRFFSSGGNDCRWPDSEHALHFFAYYPAADSMRKAAGNEFFEFSNSSRNLNGSFNIDYRLEKFRVAPEIADQADFLTAYATGTLTKDSDAGIQLDFKHQLARIELAAWGNNEKYDFEIAGVRIGNPLVEADFNFTAHMPSSGSQALWLNTGTQAPVEHIFAPGEQIVAINKAAGSHLTEATAAPIMGAGGPAMVLPMTEKIEAWEGKDDPSTATAGSYTTDKMYFSILLRVKNSAGEVAYPYPNDRDGMSVVYLAVDKDGKVARRLYKIKDLFYTSPKEDEAALYTSDGSEEICAFGWAALPVGAKWEAGKIYTYNLNYSTGIGWHDPDDPKPGEPIIERGKIPFVVTVEDWVAAEGYDPNLNVPKR